MRVVVIGSRLPDFRTFQRLLLVANEIGFLDRPSVMFGEHETDGQWGTVGWASDIRKFTIDEDAPVKLSAHETPYGARKRPRRVNPRDNVGDGRV